MLIPEEFLQSLLCSKCEEYLSVPPIKVYPNRHIKCGRCIEKGDHGVASNFNKLVMDYFEFPCINRFEGCKVILSYKDVEDHEKNCISKAYECPLCNDFKNRSAYHLQLHLKKYHLSNALHNMEALLVELDKGNIQKIAWYCKNYFLFVLMCNYDPLEQKLWLNLSNFGDMNHHCVHKFTLFTIENQVKEKSRSILCSTWNSPKQNEGFLFRINPDEYPKNIVICTFDVKEMALNMQLPSVSCNKLDRSATSIIVAAVFKDISAIQPEGVQHFEPWFYVNNLKWQVIIKREQEYFTIYLQSLDLHQQVTPGLFRKFTLVSINESKNKIFEHTYTKEHVWLRGIGRGNSKFICREELLDKSNGYIDENDSIQIQVIVKFSGKVLPVSCKDCKICHNCEVCESCTNRFLKK